MVSISARPVRLRATTNRRNAMLGRKTFSPEELDAATTTLERQLAAYDQLPEGPAREAFAPLVFIDRALALDRFFVHRLRGVTGKDGNPITELELIADTLINN